jgi:hypothetical protein
MGRTEAMNTGFHERDRQLREVSDQLDKYQRRYPELDVAYEYRIWALETKARLDPTGILDYELLFLRRLEKRRKDIQGGGRLDIAAALADWPALVNGFGRLVHGFNQERYISQDTIRVYGEEFANCSEELFSRICDRALREFERFPSVAALRRIYVIIQVEDRQARDEQTMRRESAEREALRRHAAELDAAIEALGPEERKRLDKEAALRFARFPLPLTPVLKRALLRTIYEETTRAEMAMMREG